METIRPYYNYRVSADSNPGSTVTGASPAGCAAAAAFVSGIEPLAVSGIANGGLPAVSRTTVVLGWSTAQP